MAQEQTPTPRIGDFQPPDRTTKRPPRRDAEETAEAVSSPVEAATQIPASEDEQAATERASLYEEMAKGLTPIEDYQEYLKEQGISLDEAQDIVDSLFTQGYYEEPVPLTKRIKAILRTREHGDTLRLQMALELHRPVYSHVLEEITARYNMAASLTRFGDKVFAHPDRDTDKEEVEKLFDERLKFVERMADPAFYKLSTLLARFDRKVAAVMREGVAENF